MSNHLVRCRGGQWRIGRGPEPGAFRFHSRWARVNSPSMALRWNCQIIHLSAPTLTTSNRSFKTLLDRWDSQRPAWLPIAWLYCEADPAEGPGFAAKILDAEPGDDAPALIACDWLEERGAEGWGHLAAEELAEGWAEPRTMFPSGRSSRFVRGPLHSWCRHLIATRCVSCGGRRDGEDLWGRTVRTRREARYPAIRALAEREGVEIKPDCPLCGFPAHATPPPLATPEVVR